MVKRHVSGLLLTFAVTLACGGSRPTSATPVSAAGWADEFDGPANAGPDRAKWTFDLGGGGWGNQELETYTNTLENAHLDGQGHLVIHVEATSTGYTSARLKTQGLLTAQYGRVEARIKVPSGQGIWPAFWMLGSSFPGTRWPDCGEIDIMENIGREPDMVHGSVHGPGYSGGNAVSGTLRLPNAQKFADDFHVFAIQWAPQTITFFVDGIAYHIVTPASLRPGASWVFDQAFFVILNVAVGGNWPGSPDSTSRFPQEMLIDYVRYTPSAAGATTSLTMKTMKRLNETRQRILASFARSW